MWMGKHFLTFSAFYSSSLPAAAISPFEVSERGEFNVWIHNEREDGRSLVFGLLSTLNHLRENSIFEGML